LTSQPTGEGATAPKEDAMEMDVWYDVLVRELAEAERLSDLLAQAEEETPASDDSEPAIAADSQP
jgi:hypothetical protein